jgi:hypothetical protein
MILSTTTINVLVCFASINQGILIKPGNTLRTLSVMKDIFAIAQIPDEFPREFAIHDIIDFLNCYPINADIVFKDDSLEFKDGPGLITYFYNNPFYNVFPGDENVKMLQENNIKFSLSASDFKDLHKMSKIMRLKNLKIIQNSMLLYNKKKTVCINNEKIYPIPDMVFFDFEAVLKTENLKLIPLDYDVEISPQGIACFASNLDGYAITYYISLDNAEQGIL